MNMNPTSNEQESHPMHTDVASAAATAAVKKGIKKEDIIKRIQRVLYEQRDDVGGGPGSIEAPLYTGVHSNTNSGNASDAVCSEQTSSNVDYYTPYSPGVYRPRGPRYAGAESE
ncbi:hypothetical protein STCU_11557 [Strigomonas culicis]|uniref:Uncharacterized protein n=1 Tax=Strigomonas culicis TaxID=28005 RepID=S9V030_9TRYP|nr:hypothetical protein STCU_11557 [Strigomonas culicis]|eukprot:EPY16095.1 hypothetical protein STCU_11557 [Strigomonas culicis]